MKNLVALSLALIFGMQFGCTADDDSQSDAELQTRVQNDSQSSRLLGEPLTENTEANDECFAECGGTFGQHGRSPEEFCLCAAEDAGETCYSGDDCEGLCLFLGLEESDDATQGLPFGECSSALLNFGCQTLIPRGAPTEVSLPYDPPIICID